MYLDPELLTSFFGPMIGRLSRNRFLTRRALRLAARLEGGQFRSATMRKIMADQFHVEVGAHSYGSCFEPGAFAGGASIGRYVSIASGVKRRLNHPLHNLVLHPYFYNDALGYIASRTISHQPIYIGHDAWIGENVIFTEGCTRVGIGAVIGAASVVTRNVDNFEVVAGSPARRLRLRFSEDLCERILASRWWERPINDLASFREELNVPVADWPSVHPLLSPFASQNRR